MYVRQQRRRTNCASTVEEIRPVFYQRAAARGSISLFVFNAVMFLQYLPTAQLLLTKLRDPHSELSRMHGAPDPTAGAGRDDQYAIWCMDISTLQLNIRRILNKFCVPGHTIFR